MRRLCSVHRWRNAVSSNTLRTAVARALVAVDHDQQPAVGVEALGDEIGEQGGDDADRYVAAGQGQAGTIEQAA
jgi:hypothetical protein